MPENFNPRISEIGTNDVTPSGAATIVRGLGQEFIQRIWGVFRNCDSPARVLEQLNAGVLSAEELQRLTLFAEARNVRTSTLILLILRSLTFSAI